MPRFPIPKIFANATSFGLAAGILLCLFSLDAAAQARSELNVPYIGEPADRSLSPSEEKRLGQEVMRQLLAGGHVLEDPELAEYIKALGNRLLRHTNEAEQSFTFFVVKDAAINAFALPGGYIGINAGLIIASQSESELAGVVAHEIAHVTQRHIARSMDKTSGWDIASTALVIAALIVGAHDPEIAQAALSLGMSAAIQQQINFTRAHELEADRLGILTLSAAGFDPAGMSAFFHRLSQKGQLYGESLPELLRTHPVNTTRIAEAQSRAAALPPGQTQSSLDYRLMKVRAQVFSIELASETLSYFRALHRQDPSLENRYGLALALGRNRAFDAAEAELLALLQQWPEQLNLQLSLGQLYTEAGHDAKALSQLGKTLQQHPRARPATLALAQAMLRHGQAPKARQLLLESELLLRNDPETFRLLALAARDMQESAEAHFQMAAYSRSRGDYVSAIRQLRNGLSLETLDPHDRKRLQGRLAQYNAEAPETEIRRGRQQKPLAWGN